MMVGTTRRVLTWVAAFILVVGACGDDDDVVDSPTTTAASTTSSTNPGGTTLAGACPMPGDGGVPTSASNVSTSSGDFDGDGAQDSFNVYSDGTNWYGHFNLAYGYGARVIVDPASHYGVYPVGTGLLNADLVTDIDANTLSEAWVSDGSSQSEGFPDFSPPADWGTRTTMSMFVFDPPTCAAYHVLAADDFDVRVQLFTGPGTTSTWTDLLCVYPPLGVVVTLSVENGGAWVAGNEWQFSFVTGNYYQFSQVAGVDTGGAFAFGVGQVLDVSNPSPTC